MSHLFPIQGRQCCGAAIQPRLRGKHGAPCRQEAVPRNEDAVQHGLVQQVEAHPLRYHHVHRHTFENTDIKILYSFFIEIALEAICLMQYHIIHVYVS